MPYRNKVNYPTAFSTFCLRMRRFIKKRLTAPGISIR
jgi:hypothetical protein